jgi:hypothetical protein
MQHLPCRVAEAQWKAEELFGPRGLVVDIHALDITLNFTLEELVSCLCSAREAVAHSLQERIDIAVPKVAWHKAEDVQETSARHSGV